MPLLLLCGFFFANVFADVFAITVFFYPQTIFGELISLESNSDVFGLAVFILQRLLWNPDIAAEYRHARVPHLYKDGNVAVCCVYFVSCLKFIF